MRQGKTKVFRQLFRIVDQTGFVSLRKVMLLALLAVLMPILHAEEDFLDPVLAFKFSARMLDAKTIEVNYAIADGYYMYRERFKFGADGAKLGDAVFPPGKIKFDATFQKNIEIYHHAVSVRIPVQANGTFTLKSTGQGCAEKGLCYPPIESKIDLTPPAAGSKAGGIGLTQDGGTTGISQESRNAAISGDNETNMLEAAIQGGNLFVLLPLCLVIGLGLSFTPCVLPMVPILSTIIVGEGTEITRKRGLALATIYSLGMAIIYTALGVAAGWAGEGLAASFQNPWVLGGFAILIAVLALSMFDIYQLQMPAAIQLKLMKASDRQAAGKFAGVFAMGALSGLIIGPCVTAPLLVVLVLISQTHNAILGGGILFVIAIGMSVPLLLVGFSAGWLLPRAGAWMDAIKRFFGVLLLGVALWMVSPVISVLSQMLGWALIAAGYAAYLMFNKRLGGVSKAFGAAFALLALIQVVGATTGGDDVLAPLAHLTGKPAKKAEFLRVRSVVELDAALAAAPGKTAMLDFYADWCVSCKEMEKLTFSNARVQAKFSEMVLLQADVTANSEDDKALLKRFHLFGPPGIIFFDKSGKEIDGKRVVGYQDADRFALSLSKIMQDHAG